MKLKGPTTYQVCIDDKGDGNNSKRIVSVKDADGKETTFCTEKGLLKLYVVSTKGKPIYVGRTKQPFRTRLNYGLKANGKKGYSGYLWRDYFKQVTIDIWNMTLGNEDFESMKDDPSIKRAKGGNEIKKGILVETVEAEVVLLIRQIYGQWPKYQSEIHFHQSQSTHIEEAKKIINHYRKALCPTV